MQELLTAIPLLACPVGMGLMMWFMMRGNRHQQRQPRAMSLTELRADHKRLGTEMDRAAAREETRS